MIYDRTEKIKIGKIETIKDYLIEGFDKKTAENDYSAVFFMMSIGAEMQLQCPHAFMPP